MATDREYLSIPDVLAIHQNLMKQYPAEDAALRDVGLLESALARARHARAYEDADLFMQAAVLLEGIIRNHPFVQGNKRTATVASITFLELNDYTIDVPEPELVEVVFGVADGTIGTGQLAHWVREHSIRIDSL